jgi:hypothetical protein
MASFGKQSSSGRTQTAPWGPQQPYLKEIYERAQGFSNQPRSFYPGQTYVPFSTETEQAYGGLANRARAGSGAVQAAQGLNQATLQGQYLDPSSNPWLQQTYQAASRPVMRNLQTAALPGASLEAYGRGGSGAEANRYDRATDAGGRALTDLSAQIYGGNYARERHNQMLAAQQAPRLADYDYRDLQALLGVGQGREELATRQLEDLMARFQFGQEEPRDRLTEFAQQIGAPISASTGRQRSSGWNVGILS